VVEYLKFLHGSYSFVIACLFFYQGWLGLSIRRARRSAGQLPANAVRRHRKNGPALALLAGLGFAVGVIAVLVDTGKVLEYPPHLFVGLAIVLLVIGTYLVSRKIKGLASPFRAPHLVLGICILVLYVAQVFLGLGVLF
jgi:hypothetical protein